MDPRNTTPRKSLQIGLWAALVASVGVVAFAIAKNGEETAESNRAHELIEEIDSALKARDSRRLDVAVDSLRETGEVGTTALSDALKSWNMHRRWVAIQALDRLGPYGEAALPALIELGQNPSSEADRANVMRPLVSVGRERPDLVVPVLVHALKDQYGTVRQDALMALSALGPTAKSAVPALIRYVKDRTKLGGNGSWALEALASIGHKLPVLPPRGADEKTSKQPVLLEYENPTLADSDDSREFLIDSLDNKRTASAAAIALRGLGPHAKPAVPKLIELLTDETSDMQEVAAEALGKIGPDAKSAIPYLIEGMREGSRQLPRRCAFALGEIGPQTDAVIPALIEQVKDDNSVCLFEAVFALEMIGPAAHDAAPVLADALMKTGNPAQRASFASAISRIGAGDDRVIAALVDTLLTPPGDPREFSHRLWSAQALGRISGNRTDVVEALAKALQDPVSRVRREAAIALLKIDASSQAAWQTLSALLETTESQNEWELVIQTKTEAIAAFGELGRNAEHTIPILLLLLNDDDPNVRQVAIRSLGRIGPDNEQVIAAVEGTLHDKQPSVRGNAAIVLARLGQATPTIFNILEHELKIHSRRIEAAKVLGELGSKAQPALEALRTAAITAQSPEVRAAAAEAVRKIVTSLSAP